MILLGKRTKEKTENSKKDNADQHQREEDSEVAKGGVGK
jgi:hypothetical protein